MSYDFCLGCGVLLSPHVHKCPICDFDNSFDEYGNILIPDDLLADLSDDFNFDEDVA